MARRKMTTAQAAERLGVTVRTIWRWRDAGTLGEAPREGGNAHLFYVDDVERLRAEREGTAPAPASPTAAWAYLRLTACESWDDVERLRRELAALICQTADDKGPLEDAWRAACSMAATHPDQGARGRWTDKAATYGGWLGKPGEETTRAIEHKAQAGSFCTYESARDEAAAAPDDPAMAIAQAEETRR